MTDERARSIAFLHPQMTIGGAERLIINYAVALQSHGHRVHIFTTQHDNTQCFPETIDGSIPFTLFAPRPVAALLSGSLTFFTYIKMVLLTLWLLLFQPRFDVYVVDQVALPVLLLRLCFRRVIFYCHFPEKGYHFRSPTVLYRLYYTALNVLEELAMTVATHVQTNSRFTSKAFEECFPRACKLGAKPHVIYPPVEDAKLDAMSRTLLDLPSRYFLSLNRFDPTKGVELALRAFEVYLKTTKDTQTQLVVAGGLNMKQSKNVKYFEGLQALSIELGLEKRVVFLCNISDTQRITAISQAIVLLYTPSLEHFGIVPVEAMYLRTPVLARDNGGPRESVVDGKTGFLLGEEPQLWGEKMRMLAEDPRRRDQMGEAGHTDAIQNFGFNKFIEKVINDINFLL